MFRATPSPRLVIVSSYCTNWPTATWSAVVARSVASTRARPAGGGVYGLGCAGPGCAGVGLAGGVCTPAGGPLDGSEGRTKPVGGCETDGGSMGEFGEEGAAGVKGIPGVTGGALEVQV